jgi:hypothetical protein
LPRSFGAARTSQRFGSVDVISAPGFCGQQPRPGTQVMFDATGSRISSAGDVVLAGCASVKL